MDSPTRAFIQCKPPTRPDAADLNATDNAKDFQSQEVSGSRNEMKIFHWYNHLDYVCLIAGLICVATALISLVDAVQQTRYVKERHKSANDLFSDSEAEKLSEDDLEYAYIYWGGCILRGNTLPGGTVGILIMYGIVTAIAWFASSRAVKRLLSINSTSALSKGLMQRDISAIFDFSWSKAWFTWRYKLWPSGIFSLLCLACYIAAGLSYRVAFTPRLTHHRLNFTDGLSPLLGCNPLAYYSPYDLYYPSEEEKTPPGLFNSLTYLLAYETTRAFAYNDAQMPVVNGWNVSVGWLSTNVHDPSSYADFVYTMPSGAGYWKAPFFIGVAQPTDGSMPIEGPRANKTQTLRVTDHPECGPLLQFCREKDCLWLGLSLGDLWIQQAWGLEPNAMQFTIDRAAFIHENNTCPLDLDPEIYRHVSDELQVDVPTLFQEGRPQSRTMVQTLVLAHMMSNLTSIPKTSTAKLQRLGMMTNGTNCGVPTMELEGRIGYYQRQGYFISWEFGTAAALLLWGTLLVYAAYPFKRLVVSQTVNQWMSFGADIGDYGMRGASSGYRSAQDKAIYRLNVEYRVDNTGKVTLEKGRSMERDAGKRAKLQFGLPYV